MCFGTSHSWWLYGSLIVFRTLETFFVFSGYCINSQVNSACILAFQIRKTEYNLIPLCLR